MLRQTAVHTLNVACGGDDGTSPFTQAKLDSFRLKNYFKLNNGSGSNVTLEYTEPFLSVVPHDAAFGSRLV